MSHHIPTPYHCTHTPTVGYHLKLVSTISVCPYVVRVDFHMSDRQAKVARASGLRRSLPHMSQSALVGMLREAKRQPLPDVTRRDDLRFHRNTIANTDTPYGTIVQRVPLPLALGGVWLLAIQAMWPMLYMTASHSDSFANLIVTTANRLGPPTLDKPWRVALYSDAVDPASSALAGVLIAMLSMYHWQHIYGTSTGMWEYACL